MPPNPPTRALACVVGYLWGMLEFEGGLALQFENKKKPRPPP